MKLRVWPEADVAAEPDDVRFGRYSGRGLETRGHPTVALPRTPRNCRRLMHVPQGHIRLHGSGSTERLVGPKPPSPLWLMSALGPVADLERDNRDVRFTPGSGHRQRWRLCRLWAISRRSITSSQLESYSGNPAFRRPSINSFECDCLRRPILSDIVKAGSTSSRRAAASRASASRPR
jgi:hypothetical protein